MGGKPKWPDGVLDDVASMRERGWSFLRIQQRIKAKHGVTISEGAISWQCLRLGADSPKLADKVLPQTKKGPAVCMRDGHPVRAFQPHEDALLRELGDKVSRSELGRRITGRLMTLARQDERRARAEGAA